MSQVMTLAEFAQMLNVQCLKCSHGEFFQESGRVAMRCPYATEKVGPWIDSEECANFQYLDDLMPSLDFQLMRLKRRFEALEDEMQHIKVDEAKLIRFLPFAEMIEKIDLTIGQIESQIQTQVKNHFKQAN